MTGVLQDSSRSMLPEASPAGVIHRLVGDRFSRETSLDEQEHPGAGTAASAGETYEKQTLSTNHISRSGGSWAAAQAAVVGAMAAVGEAEGACPPARHFYLALSRSRHDRGPHFHADDQRVGVHAGRHHVTLGATNIGAYNYVSASQITILIGFIEIPGLASLGDRADPERQGLQRTLATGQLLQ